MIKAVLFDLDGVITATSELHYIAWKNLASSIGIEIDREFNETLKGVDRKTSLLRILALGDKKCSEKEFDSLMDKKNEEYVKSLDMLSPSDILPGIKEFLSELKENDIKISIASASKNAPLILEQLKLMDYVDYIANPNDVKQSKPAPDIFLLAAKGVGVDIKECVGIEDAISGLEAIKKAGAKSITVDIKDSGADIVLNDTSELNLDLLKTL